MDTIARRSRMRRTPTGKRIELTPRDLDIFRALARYRYLSSTFIHEFVGGASQTRFKERLGDLFHEGYLDRPSRQWEMAECRHRPVIHELGTGAKRVLEQQSVVEEPRTWLGASVHRQFSHSSMVCETLASIELGTRLCPGVRFISWPEILAKAPATTRASPVPFRFPAPATSCGVVPDALFGLEYLVGEAKTYRFFALETDRGTMPVVRSDQNQTSYLGKLGAYRNLISRHDYKSHLGIPNLLVLTVTTDNQRLEEIMRRLREQGDGAAAFLFKALADRERKLPAPHLLVEPWQRLDVSPLQIDR